MKNVLQRGLPPPLNIIVVLCIDKFIVFLETKKKESDTQSAEIIMAMKAISNYWPPSTQVGTRLENDSKNLKVLEMMSEFAMNLEKTYLITMNRVIHSYLNNYFKNLGVSQMPIEGILKNDKMN